MKSDTDRQIDRQTDCQSQTMINQDRKCKTLTDKSRSHKKAKFMNSDTVSQTDSQPDRHTDRQEER